jgi:aspartate/methionine/tyrosine aminotransferase
MRHPSLYLDWYINVPKMKYDFRSSGIMNFRHDACLRDIDLGQNYVHGNPEATQVIARRYNVKPENVFLSSEGASGQIARVIRFVAEKNPGKKEAVVEFPTYEPLLRQVQEHFPKVKRLERKEKSGYRLDEDALRRLVSEKTALVVFTNPHAPTGAVTTSKQMKEMTDIAHDCGGYVLCDEIYAEFDRRVVPTLFSVDPENGITVSSFTKAYGLGGLKLGVALASRWIVDELYADVLNTVGNSPNIVQMIAARLLGRDIAQLEMYKHGWDSAKTMAERWLQEQKLDYFPSKVGVTYWVELPIKDTRSWTNEHTITRHSLATVPGAFFLFGGGYTLKQSRMARLSLGAVDPNRPDLLEEGLSSLEKAIASPQ